ncbi:type II secretion system protein GspK [Pseudomonas sp.]|uniref:type II secretion system protein GspK n=1 Tax=Pseudomonas sp. TaxID=306 RepID=UPI00258694B2|nr:type II secretion system protein GspK [Pseudomonas sp.]
MTAQRGVALLVVLWVLAVLATLLGALAATVQVQHRQALWQASHTQAVFAAEAGVAQAVMARQARDPQARWPADGQPHQLRLGDADVRVSLYSERGKLDLNAASAPDLSRLLKACGAAPQAIEPLLQALEHLRQGPVPLRTLDELRELPGMGFALYHCAVPWITVWSGQAQPDPALAPAPLARALGLPAVREPDADPGPIITVQSEARLRNGYHTTLQVTLMLTQTKEGARPYRVLRWQE